MDFLYKLYSYNYFGIGLFIVITILAFAFLVILFFGKKDEKARRELQKIEENREAIKELERNTTEEEKEELETIPLENEFRNTRMTEPLDEREVLDPVIESMVQEPEVETPYLQDDLDRDFALEREAFEQKEYRVEPEKNNDIDIFNLSALEKESNFEQEPITYMDLKNEEYDFGNQEEGNKEQYQEEPISYEPDARETPRRVTPSVFSSVYKNNEREDIFREETKETENYASRLEPETYELKQESPVEQVAKEQAPEPVRPVTPKKPEFVLPKRADMPRLNKNTDNTSDSIIKF